MGQDAKWTFMVYMAGDNDLAAAGERDLAEIRSIGSSVDVNVVVEFDRKGDTGTERLLVRKEGVEEAGIALGDPRRPYDQTTARELYFKISGFWGDGKAAQR